MSTIPALMVLDNYTQYRYIVTMVTSVKFSVSPLVRAEGISVQTTTTFVDGTPQWNAVGESNTA